MSWKELNRRLTDAPLVWVLAVFFALHEFQLDGTLFADAHSADNRP
jgi:hypothetical protein